MQFFIGVTDNAWYRFLARLQPDEVNFWRPSGRSFGAIPIGAPFLFKLHSPLNFIVGGGFFVRADQLPLTLAWDTFGQKNGAASITDVRSLIQARRKDSGNMRNHKRTTSTTKKATDSCAGPRQEGQVAGGL